jgi:hypothetical protein
VPIDVLPAVGTSMPAENPPSGLTTLPAKIHSSVLESLTGLGEKRLRQLSADGVLPAFERAMWPTHETLRAIISYYKRRSDSAGGKEDLERKLDLEKLRKLRLQNAKVAREVIAIEDAKKAHGDIYLRAKPKMESAGPKLGPICAFKDADFISVRINSEMREIMEDIAAPADYHYLDEDPIAEEEAGEDEDSEVSR